MASHHRRSADLVRAWLLQVTAPLTVHYGRDLRFAGRDLARPERVRVPTRHGRVTVHLYRPSRERELPVHVHFHGGAWLMRHPGMDDWWCRYVAATAGVVVANVDFSVSPQVCFPVAHEQCRDVVAWLTEYGDRCGVDGDRLSVGGFSSGGNLAASVCLQLRDAGAPVPRLQVLGVPALDLSTEPRDGDPGMVGPALRRLVRRVHFPDPASRSSAYASPLLADDLGGLPPAVVLTAECDVLRDEGDAYAARLVVAGIDVWHDVTPGADHYFLTEDPQRARQTMARVAERIAGALQPA